MDNQHAITKGGKLLLAKPSSVLVHFVKNGYGIKLLVFDLCIIFVQPFL